MFTIIAISDPVVCTAPVSVIDKLGIRLAVDDDISVAVGGFEISPKIVIGTFGMTLDDLVKSRFQRLVTLTLGIVIVAAGYGSNGLYAYKNCEHQAEKI